MHCRVQHEKSFFLHRRIPSCLSVGVFVGAYGKHNYEKLRGVLLFASYLTRRNLLKDYPLPVLHISGDLDGLTRITRIVDTFE